MSEGEMENGTGKNQGPAAKAGGIESALAIVGSGFLGLILWMSMTTTGSTGLLILPFAAIAVFQIFMDGHLLGLPFRDKARRKIAVERKPVMQAIYLVVIAVFAIFVL